MRGYYAKTSRSTETRVLPDPKFGNVELSKFMNVDDDGRQKSVAERIVYGAFAQIERRPARTPEVFSTASATWPIVEVKSVGLAVPTTRFRLKFVRPRRMALAMRWLRESCAQAR